MLPMGRNESRGWGIDSRGRCWWIRAEGAVRVARFDFEIDRSDKENVRAADRNVYAGRSMHSMVYIEAAPSTSPSASVKKVPHKKEEPLFRWPFSRRSNGTRRQESCGALNDLNARTSIPQNGPVWAGGASASRFARTVAQSSRARRDGICRPLEMATSQEKAEGPFSAYKRPSYFQAPVCAQTVWHGSVPRCRPPTMERAREAPSAASIVSALSIKRNNRGCTNKRRDDSTGGDADGPPSPCRQRLDNTAD